LGKPLYAPICVEVEWMEEEGGRGRCVIVAAVRGFLAIGGREGEEGVKGVEGGGEAWESDLWGGCRDVMEGVG
jgi:hypothetical protein